MIRRLPELFVRWCLPDERLLSLKGVDGHANLPVCFSPASNTFLDRLEHIGRIAARATLPADTCWDLLNLHVAPSHLMVESDTLLSDWPAAMLTCLVFPEAHPALLSSPVLINGYNTNYPGLGNVG